MEQRDLAGFACFEIFSGVGQDPKHVAAAWRQSVGFMIDTCGMLSAYASLAELASMYGCTPPSCVEKNGTNADNVNYRG